MFPGIYGFQWSAGYLIFLGIFYAVVLVVLGTVTLAVVRACGAARHHQVDHIRWESEFHDLPECDRRCRHEIAGDLAHRTCDNAFDCRTCATHPKIVAALQSKPPAADVPDALGFPVPLDRLYHRGHTWVAAQPDGTVTVGLDELARRLAGKPEQVELPPVGAHVEVNGAGWKMRRYGAEVRVLSPVDGEVVATGGAGEDWFLKVKPTSLNMTHLLQGAEVKRWLLREMERLHVLLGPSALGPTLADGGAMVDDLPATNPKADWDGIWGGMFLEP